MRVFLAAAVFAAFSVGQAAAQSETPRRNLPADIDKQSFSRLPLKKRTEFQGADLAIYDAVAGKDADGNPRPTSPLGPQAVSLWSMGVAGPMNDLNGYVRKIVPGTAIYHLCSLIAAREFQEDYEWWAHERGAVRSEVSRAAIDAIKFDRSTDGVPEREALVIHLGRAIFRDRHVSTELYNDVVKEFGQQGMFEITAAIGDYAMAAIMLKAIDQHLPDASIEPLPVIPYTAR